VTSSPLSSRRAAPLSTTAKSAHKRPLMRAAYAQLERGLVLRYEYVKPWAEMSAEERVAALAFLAADLRALAEQMDEARLEVAAEELTT